METALWTCLKIGAALLVLALLDYGFQWWKHEQDLRMTTQEMREELKTLQGDPQIAARRKAVQRQLALNRIGTAVPKASVVVTNPTELAIAIQYDIETMAAPIVVAKGAGSVALRIRRLALEHNVPVVERKELARALYKHVEVGKPIPPEQYAAMAEVLRYVYQLQGKTVRFPQPSRRVSSSELVVGSWYVAFGRSALLDLHLARASSRTRALTIGVQQIASSRAHWKPARRLTTGPTYAAARSGMTTVVPWSVTVAVLLEVVAPAAADLRLDRFFEGVGGRAVALAVVTEAAILSRTWSKITQSELLVDARTSPSGSSTRSS